MSINFSRNRAQVYYEQLIGVSNPDEINDKRDQFVSYSLSTSEALRLRSELNLDALDFFYNGMISFAEGIDNVFQKRFSWATIKLYYSVYYLIRASLAMNGFAILRCNSMFRLEATKGAKPFNTRNRKYNTTHEGTISHYKDLFSHTDRLLSNKIQDDDVYAWIMNAREIVNYRSISFLDPECLDFWSVFSSCVNDATFAITLKKLEDDPYILCFQEEYAVIAIPIKLIQQTLDQIKRENLHVDFENQRGLHIRTIMSSQKRSIAIFPSLFMSS